MGGKQGEHVGTLPGRNGKGEGLAGRKGRGGGTGREDRKGSWEELGGMDGELGGKDGELERAWIKGRGADTGRKGRGAETSWEERQGSWEERSRGCAESKGIYQGLGVKQGKMGGK